MTTISLRYDGSLHVHAEHSQSRTVLNTDAPLDNGGKGESFSPTDLLAAALGSCAFTIMAKKAETMGIDLTGSRADVQKIMAAEPRRVAEVIIDFHMSIAADEKTRIILINTAHACPVAKSLAAELTQTFRFHWQA